MTSIYMGVAALDYAITREDYDAVRLCHSDARDY